MIGIDTNVLVRYLTQDDASQVTRVDALLDDVIDDDDGLYIDDIVLCEVVWVLRAAYRRGKSEVVEALERILDVALFSFEHRELLRSALDAYRTGSGDFADYVIGLRNARAGCEHTVTFDHALHGQAPFAML